MAKETGGYFEGFPGAKKPVPAVIPIEEHRSGYLTDRGETDIPLTWVGCMTEHKPDK